MRDSGSGLSSHPLTNSEHEGVRGERGLVRPAVRVTLFGSDERPQKVEAPAHETSWLWLRPGSECCERHLVRSPPLLIRMRSLTSTVSDTLAKTNKARNASAEAEIVVHNAVGSRGIFAVGVVNGSHTGPS